MAHCKHGGRLTPTLGVAGSFLVGTFTNKGNWRGLKVHPGARRLPPAAGLASDGLFHHGVFAARLSCPPSRPLIRSAGSVCNGVLPARAQGFRSLLTGLLVLPRHASARDSSSQAPCPPGFGSGRGCSGRVRAPVVTGLRGKSGCLAREGGLRAGAREGTRCGVNRRSFGLRLRLAVAAVRLAGVLRQGRFPLITRQGQTSIRGSPPQAAGCPAPNTVCS